MRALTMAFRVMKQLVKDPRTLALLFVVPVLVLFLLDAVLSADIGKPRVQAVGLPAGLLSALEKEADVTTVSGSAAALDALKYRRTDAVIAYSAPTVSVHVEGTQTAVTAAVKKAVAAAVAAYSKEQAEAAVRRQVQQIAQQAQKQVRQILLRQAQAQSGGQAAVPQAAAPRITAAANAAALTLPGVSYDYLNGSDDTGTFQTIAPLLMGFFIFFFVFLIAGVAFLRERVSGTLERLLATPVRRYEIVLGYFLGFGAFALVQTFVVQVEMMNVLHVTFRGSFLLVLLVNLLLAAVSLSLGTLLSAFARNELQLFQFIPVVIVPQILLCGLFSLRGAPAWVAVLSRAFPLTYGANALTDVALRGFGLRAIGPDLFVLLGFTAVFLFLNAQVLKKYRRI